MQAGLNERLPILEAAGDTIVSKMGDVTMGFDVVKPEVCTQRVIHKHRHHADGHYRITMRDSRKPRASINTEN